MLNTIYQQIQQGTFLIQITKIILEHLYHSLGSVLSHHIIVDHEQPNGRLYSTPSLAIPHTGIAYCFAVWRPYSYV